MGKLIFGIGINDAGYVTQKTVAGSIVICPYYKRWVQMLERGYSKNLKLKRNTYKDVYVCKEWLTFSNFKAWMETQDWKGKQLDKDLLVSGNKVYGPDTCIFVSQEINKLLLKSDASRGNYPLWVTWSNRDNKFLSQIRHKSKNVHIGYFDDKISAHQAGQRKKIEILTSIAEFQEEIVKKSLFRIAMKIQLDINNKNETIEY